MKTVFFLILITATYSKVFAQSFVNASLEEWGDTNTCEINTPPDGWSDYTNSGIGLDQADFSICPTTIPPNASEGNVYARAYAAQDAGEGMYQNISGFAIGNTYQFSFDYAGSNLYPGTNYVRWHVFIDDIEVDSTSMFNSLDDFWTTHVTTFTATANTHKIGFRLYIDSLIFDSGSGAIDNIIFQSTNVQPNADIQAVVTKICPDSCIAFGNNSTNATSYEWFFDGGNPGYSTDSFPQNICYATSGFYDVTLIAHNGANSDTATMTSLIEVYPAPSPTITQSNDTLSVLPISGATYQWQLDNNDISGATNDFYVAATNGVYNVIVTNGVGCTGSDETKYFGVGVESLSGENDFTLFPNPADESVTIRLGRNEKAEFKLYNKLGQLIRNEMVENEATIDLSNFSNGVYYITVQSENDLVEKRLIVTHH